MVVRSAPFRLSGLNLPHAKEWLEYSTMVNAMYCFACRMFGMPGTSEENWISKGVKGANWKNTLKRIRDHSVFHIDGAMVPQKLNISIRHQRINTEFNFSLAP